MSSELSDKNYDVVIDINSIMKLNEGWQIKYNGKDIESIRKMIESNNKSFISILGHSNRGKTYILQKITQQKLHPGFEITTKGISIKAFGQNAILLDTVGNNAPLLVEDQNNDPRNEIDFFQKKLNEINLCQIITNYIVQTFVIQHADILICVVGMLTSSEQQFLNKIKKNCYGKKQLIVIHNLIHFYEREEIENYIETVLKKSIIHDFEEIIIPNFEGDKQNFNKYYTEKNPSQEHEFDILHFIMGNDANRETGKVRFFNEPTITAIRDRIDLSINKKINIFEKLREHIKIISSQVLENELKNIEIIKEEKKGPNFEKIICKEEIKPKEVTADELNNIYFIGKEYEPPFRYYKLGEKFTVEIQICCEIDFETINVQQKFIYEEEEFLITIKGEKKVDKNENIDNDTEIHELINKRNWKNFKVEFKISLKDFEIDGLEDYDKKDKNAYEMEYGILFIHFIIQ